ncbi:MAG: hypothetical protein J7639_28290, partial [Paenibacillaceae bacterium]|nr:hypothetical protein [Paenibacillaceae bacterium]
TRIAPIAIFLAISPPEMLLKVTCLLLSKTISLQICPPSVETMQSRKLPQSKLPNIKQAETNSQVPDLNRKEMNLGGRADRWYSFIHKHKYRVSVLYILISDEQFPHNTHQLLEYQPRINLL